MQPLLVSNIITRWKKLRQAERQQVVDGEINGDAAAAAVGDQTGGLGFDELPAGMVEPEHDIASLQFGSLVGQNIGRAAQKIEREASRIAVVPGTALVAQVHRLDAKALRRFVEKS